MTARDTPFDALATAHQLLLAGSGLSDKDVRRALQVMRAHRIDDAELYFQAVEQESWTLEDGEVAGSTFKIDKGFGARVVVGERAAHAYSQELSAEALLDAARATRAIAAAGSSRRVRLRNGNGERPAPLFEPVDPAGSVGSDRKVELLRAVDRAARGVDPRVVGVSATLGIQHEVVLIARVDGLLVADVRPLVRLKVQVVAHGAKGHAVGSADVGGRYGLSMLDPQATGIEAANAATTNLDARPIPQGQMAVVLGAGWPGILIHESVGHGLEGDHIRKGMSLFAGRVGQRVAAKGVSIVDDGSIPLNRGSLSVDDEGNRTRGSVLIEDGILCGFIHDRLSARVTGASSSANARRQSYAHPPLPRMTNTFMMSGPRTREEVIASLRRGLYITRLDSGQVDITSGNFVFSVSRAFWVENGKLLHPVAHATLAGNGMKTLRQVSLVGNDLEFDTGGGVCSKEGQHLPVSVGQPTIRIDAMLVGGTA